MNKLPNFFTLSSMNKEKINKQKFNFYWMLANQNFKKAR